MASFPTRSPEDPNTPCPCGSGDSYSSCCRPYHRGEKKAASPEACLRSRFKYLNSLVHTDCRLAHYILRAPPSSYSLSTPPSTSVHPDYMPSTTFIQGLLLPATYVRSPTTSSICKLILPITTLHPHAALWFIIPMYTHTAISKMERGRSCTEFITTRLVEIVGMYFTGKYLAECMPLATILGDYL